LAVRSVHFENVRTEALSDGIEPSDCGGRFPRPGILKPGSISEPFSQPQEPPTLFFFPSTFGDIRISL
jgi:hypothetical protein